MRLLIIKEYMLKGVLPIQDLVVSLNCIEVDCESLDKCPCNVSTCGSDPVAHFEIPQVLFDYGTDSAIQYIGSVDKQNSFIVYTDSLSKVKTYQKYRKRGKNKPFVYIDTTPNKNGLLDGYIFNAPLLKRISIVGIFKDPRQLEDFQCNCSDGELEQYDDTKMDSNFNYIDALIKDRLTRQKLQYYRQYQAPILPNDQQNNAG